MLELHDEVIIEFLFAFGDEKKLMNEIFMTLIAGACFLLLLREG